MPDLRLDRNIKAIIRYCGGTHDTCLQKLERRGMLLINKFCIVFKVDFIFHLRLFLRKLYEVSEDHWTLCITK